MTLEQLAYRTIEVAMHMPARDEAGLWASILAGLSPRERVELARHAWLSLAAYGYTQRGERA